MQQSIQFDNSSKFDRDLRLIFDSLETADGVFEPSAGSFALAECVHGLSGSFLDLGTGTGIISIVVSKKASSLLATDCSTKAVQCAERNFKRFGVRAEVRKSDMFDRVIEKFDYVVFNPPVHVHETELDRWCKNGVKRLLPATFNEFTSVVARPVFKYSIRSVLKTFYRAATRHLNPGGMMFVNTLSSDIRWLSDWVGGNARLTLCRHTAQFCIVAIAPLGQAQEGAQRATHHLVSFDETTWA
jgi:methylase of polypeptide subunit release factors